MLSATGKILASGIQQIYGSPFHFRVAAQNQQQSFQHSFRLSSGQQHLCGLLQGREIARAGFGGGQRLGRARNSVLGNYRAEETS